MKDKENKLHIYQIVKKSSLKMVSFPISNAQDH